MIERIYLVNAREKYFNDLFLETCQKQDFPCHSITTIDSIFYIANGQVQFINNNQVAELESSYFFIRMRSADSFFSYLLSEHLENNQVRFSDPINLSHSISYGKIAQLVRLTPKGLPFPDSVICRRHSYKLHRDFIINAIGFPCVFKCSGARGEAVWKIEDEDALEKKFEELPFEASIIQRYIPNDFDLRVIVFDGMIIGSMRRNSVDGFSNTGYDAVFELTDLTEDEIQLAIDATAKSGLDFAGVDIVRTEQGLMLWEINMCPQLDRFMAATGINVASKLLNHIKKS